MVHKAALQVGHQNHSPFLTAWPRVSHPAAVLRSAAAAAAILALVAAAARVPSALAGTVPVPAFPARASVAASASSSP